MLVMNSFKKCIIRVCFALSLLYIPTKMYSVGWTPTDAGWVVNLEQGERFLLSVWVDKNGNGTEEPGEEFFVSNYTRYTGGYYGYEAGMYIKLLSVTEITEMDEWSVGAPLSRGDKSLGGIAYTIWNDGKTLKTSDSFKFLGDLTDNYSDSKACDVVFVIPTERGVPTVDGRAGLSSFDPNGTLGRGTAPFDGATGTGFLGMTYREVFMFCIPKANSPQSYTNASLVTFNTTLSTWNLSSGAGNIAKGKAAYAYADKKHDPTPRTLFRLYLLDNPINSCSSYFFATDEQDYKRYRKNENNPQKSSDSTKIKKIYTMDRLSCMSRVENTKYYQTDLVRVPEPDSTYYYVGWNNGWRNGSGGSPSEPLGSSSAKSAFKNIRTLPLTNLPTFNAPAGAMGRMVVDTSETADNLGVKFEPAGYMLKVSTGKNVPMVKNHDNEWVTQDLWDIDEKWLSLKIWATLMTGSEFSEDDPGADIAGWTDSILGSAVRVSTGGYVTAGMKGYAVIYTNDANPNGNMTFIPANMTRHVHYDNNDFLGVQIPDQYPMGEYETVMVENPRLKAGYTFDGWTRVKVPGVGDKVYSAGDTIQLSAGETVLYAQAHYEGTLQVAISFMGEDDKRYFLTHPNTSAPRYARARTFEDWENVWQGMENAENLDPNYVSTFEVRCPIAEIHRKDGDIPDLKRQEHVLDPRSYTMRGYEDSLVFYEFFHPADGEYLGLYYTAPNTILANNTWAGLFTTTSEETDISWPTYKTPYISGVKLKSERYVEEYDHVNKPDSLILKVRSNSDQPWVIYNATDNQFDGQADSATATTFDISAVSVADAHYIVSPDTTYAWRDTITFGFHQNEQIREAVWSSLIGKQLLAVMRLGEDTVYFHPNRNKIITDPNNLYLSKDFRVSQAFELIRDSRVNGALSVGDSAQMEATDYYWHNDIVSGINSPMEVKDAEGNYIDIVDTFRVTLSHGAISKIKEYHGYWKKGSAGLKVSTDGSVRYRDVIIKTNTYHYGAEQTRYVLKPDKESYSFGPLVGQTQQINFMLTQETYRQILDKDNYEEGEYVTHIDTITSQLAMISGGCGFNKDNHSFEVSEVVGSHVTLRVINENSAGVNHDTLIISKIKIVDTEHTLTTPVRISLIQAPLEGTELIWSFVYNKQLYFLTAGSGGLIARKYTLKEQTLYKEGTTTHLIKGLKDDANSDKQYITPWQFAYSPNPSKMSDTLSLFTKLPSGTNKYFCIEADHAAAGASPSLLIYRHANTYVNDNANFEEQVRLRFGSEGWLKLTSVTGTVPTIELTTDSAAATVFSWSYLLSEYSLTNNEMYPSRDFALFGYNQETSVDIQTRYKAYREYSMLINNTLTYCCRKEETRIDSLTSASREWLTSYTIDTIRDHRMATLSGLSSTTDPVTLITTVTASGSSPMGLVNIVDTLRVRLSLQAGAPTYRFKGDWSGFTSISDAHLKIPLIRRAYHEASYDSLVCVADHDDMHFTFPATAAGVEHTYDLSTFYRYGTRVLNTDDEVVTVTTSTSIDVTKDRTDTMGMHLDNPALAEVRLMDEYGNKPNWCEITSKDATSITVTCLENGIRSPRSAYLYLAYIITLNDKMRFVNYRLSVSQVSSFTYANNQQLIHSNGASGDEKMADGRQQVHENKRILYYYPDQDVELPVRERAFYGWWRWYREGNDVNEVDVSDSDVPDSLWRQPPINEGNKYKIPFRIIGDSVPVNPAEPTGAKKLVTMGRWTVFHYKSIDYGNKKDPPAKNPRVAPPITTFGKATKPTLTYAVDISNYYDNLPMSITEKNQVDRAMMDTMLEIIEPTLSLRETFELRPWTEMAERMESYKSSASDDLFPLDEEKYLEDHVMMAPTGNRLLLQTEQRYNYDHLKSQGLSESLLCYYMRDDNWGTWAGDTARQDTMIWCGGWDAECKWFTYNPKTEKYTACNHPVMEETDFLQVPAKSSITSGNDFDTVYYCLRARSQKTTGTAPAYADDETVDGDFYFNICRYKLIYHNPKLYGPKVETYTNGVPKALITNEEISQRYEVLERLDFDYIQPGSDYHVYPHPLPWADASYGYTYPETPSLPHNRYHAESDFPNHGEYGLINRIPYTTYWYRMEQHGGAANGYMIYCDGMASAGQVAALTIHTNLCAGQKMFFSGYVGNPSSQKGKSNPNFIFSVQGSLDGTNWDDITSYMTGDIQPTDKWYQIYFPIIHNDGGKEYTDFRVRIYNMAANFDGNDFVIDDMCIFATKPPLIAYQAQTTCQDYGMEDTDTHVLLRIDYQGITGEGYNNADVCYTVRRKAKGSGETSFVEMSDGYLREEKKTHVAPETVDTIFGKIYIPSRTHEPQDQDSVYTNMNDLIMRYDTTSAKYKDGDKSKIVREGYIYEILEGDIRPVKYIVHSAQMNPQDTFTVHMSGDYRQLLSSICGMTSHLKISSRMVLKLNGEEQPETEQVGLCANSTYDISLNVRGSMYRDSVAPIDVVGSCVSDWLLYGDTAQESSKARYGFYYSDIKKVVTNILRYAPASKFEKNDNQFATNLASINRAELTRVQTELWKDTLTRGVDPYALLDSLVTKGFLLLYKKQLTSSVVTGDSVQYVIFPIVGSGSEEVKAANVEVCPNPIFIKLKPGKGGGAPLIVGGLRRDSTESLLPITVLAATASANNQIKLHVDSIMSGVGIYSVNLRSTDDPDYREGVHLLRMVPDKSYPNEDYYHKGDSITLRPASTNNYTMKPGYNYTFNIVMQTWTGQLTTGEGCEVGTVPFTVSIVPDYVRWDPQSASSNNWNDADNWLGIDENNEPIHAEAHFVPMSNTHVLIPKTEGGKPYPVVQPMPTVYKDSIQKVGFEYNQCNVIRFLPGAAIAQQQRMNFTEAIVDMPLPQEHWALRSAPIQGMISGDLFMANADLTDETPLWEVGTFDLNGRNTTTGNASFWLSLYSTKSIHYGNDQGNDTTAAKAEWGKVTNGLTLSLPAGTGWAVYTRTKSGKDAAVRLPKSDDIYYYYTRSGDRVDDMYEHNLVSKRDGFAGGTGLSGQLAFGVGGANTKDYKITNEEASTSFVFGNPTMGYIDIWGFISDNSGLGLSQEFHYIDASGSYTQVTESIAVASTDTISEQKRYLPPMHAIVLTATSGTELTLRLNANRIVTSHRQKAPLTPAAGAPARRNETAKSKGIMTVTAINPVAAVCKSRLLLGQGYHRAVRDGEDAVLTTINIDRYSSSTPATPFNIYASEGNYGLSIDLRDEIVNVPVSFYMTNLPYAETTQLWFTGVNNIDGPLVLYDALTDTERPIIDGICHTIETPQQSHETRYFIRLRGYNPDDPSNPIVTGEEHYEMDGEQAVKIMHNGHVYILRNGQVFTIFGQKVR